MAARLLCLMLCAAPGLAGCGSVERFYDTKLPLDTPIDWWHQLQGGVIADERPPPPGINDPYPNLDLIPKKPTPTDGPTRRALAGQLAGERDRAGRLAAQDPIGTVPPVVIPGAAPPAAAPAAAPAGSGKTAVAPSVAAAPPAVPDSPPPMARIDAADAKPLPPAAPPPPAPPAPAAIQAAASPTAPPRQAGAQFKAGPVPALPTAAPALPNLAGIPADAFAPATPKPLPQVDAAFVQDSAVLRPESTKALQALAARRSGGSVAVLGGGDARSALPDVQAAALPLAWRRAKAIQEVLASAGVPAGSMHLDAAALARGGIARLVN